MVASRPARRRSETGLTDSKLGRPVDINGDGDLDLCRSDDSAGTLAWHENRKHENRKHENRNIHRRGLFPAQTAIFTAANSSPWSVLRCVRGQILRRRQA
jgi:hypothetical protein